jgi:transketolase
VERIKEGIMVTNEKNRLHERSYADLRETSHRLSRRIIEITTAAGSGHPSSSLSIIDILTVLYFGGVMRYDPQFSEWPERDRFILSKGHAAPGLYVTLAEAGYFPYSMLETFRQIGSPLEGHPNRRSLPGIEASTGSLGQGLSIGLGHALAGKLDQKNYRVYVIIGDGESNQGQIWEAAMSAASYNTDNLTAILDYNKYQQTASVKEVMPSLEPVLAKWQSFGWNTTEIDGHNIEEVQTALKEVQQVTGKPQIIVAHTKKGKGLSPFENNHVNRKHGEPLTKEEAQIAFSELEQMYARN